jgi:hypothetical protein
MDPVLRRKRIVLQGDVPSPINPPPGCRFHPRCPWAKEVCRQQTPQRLELDGHQFRCHAVQKEQMGTGDYELPKQRTLPDEAALAPAEALA